MCGEKTWENDNVIGVANGTKKVLGVGVIDGSFTAHCGVDHSKKSGRDKGDMLDASHVQ